ncbi:MAG: BamA/TamA family outer membrane protein [Candidatus Neomarinimicrobiota bacterium]
MSKYKNNDLFRFSSAGIYHHELSKKRHLGLSAKVNYSWISNTKVDSFFYFYAGGISGLKGYTYYSLGGTRKFTGELDLAIPLLRERHFTLGWFTLQNIALVFITQAGDAWNPKFNNFTLKKSAGVQMRFQGFSFYNYPTAIGIGIHHGFDNYSDPAGEYLGRLKEKNRVYFTMLFDF